MNTLFQLLENPVAIYLGWVLVHSIWIGFVATILGAAATSFMSSRQAAARHNVLLAALLAILPAAILWHAISRPSPTLTAARSESLETKREPTTQESIAPINDIEGKPVLPVATGLGPGEVPAELSPESPEAVEHGVDRTVDREEANTSGLPSPVSLTVIVEPWLPAIVLGWLAGICLITTRTSLAWRRTRRDLLLGRSQPSEQVLDLAQRIRKTLGIRAVVRVFESSIAQVPASIGFLRPIVILPASLLTELSAMEIEAILAHELAHVRRADFLVNLMQVAFETLLFFHPAVWWLGSRIRWEREHACDDIALNVTNDRVGYAKALTETAAHAKRNASTLAMTADGGQSTHSRPFTARIRRIIAVDSVPGRFQPWGPLLLLGLLAALLVPFAAPTVPLQTPSPSPTPEITAAADPFVSGVVVNTDGAPIAGATVRLSRTPVPYLTRFEALAQTETDTDGQFRIVDVKVPQSGRPVPLKLIITAPNYGVHWDTISEPQQDVKISLQPQAAFTGKLILSGKPVSNASIRVLHVMSIEALKDIDIQAGSFPSRHKAYIDLEGLRVPILTKSDADGKFVLDQIPPNVGFAFQVDHPSVAKLVYFGTTSAEKIDDIRAGYWVFPPRDRSAEDIVTQRSHATLTPVHKNQATIDLTQGATLRVQIVDSKTKDPLPKVRIEVRGSGLSYHKAIRQIRSDDEGWCEIPQCRPGSQINVTNVPLQYSELDRTKFAQREQRVYLTTMFKIAIKPEGPQEYELALDRGAILTGNIVEERGGAAVAEVGVRYVSITVDDDHQPYYGSTKSAADGRYVLVVPLGEGELRCNTAPRGFEFDRKKVLAKPDLKEAAISEINIRLKRLAPMVFAFEDAKGRPVKVTSDFRAYSSSSSYSNFPITTDADGKFDGSSAIRGGSTVKRIQFIARSVDGNLAAYVFEEDVEALRKQQGTTVKMRPVASVRGQLVDEETQKPIAGGSVRLSVQYDAVSGQGVAAKQTDDQGGFEFAGLVPGMTYSIGAGAENYHAKNSIKTRFVAEPSTAHPIKVALAPKAESRAKMARELSRLKAPSVQGLDGNQALNRLLSAYRQADKQYRADLKERKFKVDDIVDRREPLQIFVPAIVALGKQHAGTEVERKAFLWACRQSLTAGTMERYAKARADAAAMLIEKYANAPELSPHTSEVIYASPEWLAAATGLMKSTQRVTRAHATVAAAQIFARQYDDPRIGGQEKVRQRAIELFETVAADYSNVKYGDRTLADVAKDRLYGLKNLPIGAIAPDIVGQDLDGKPMKLSDFRGKVVVIHHWDGTANEFAKMKRLADRHRSKPLVIVGLNTNNSATKAKAAMEGKSSIRSWHDPKRLIMRKWGLGVPNTQVIGHDGKLIYKGQRRSYGSVEDAVDDALERLAEE